MLVICNRRKEFQIACLHACSYLHGHLLTRMGCLSVAKLGLVFHCSSLGLALINFSVLWIFLPDRVAVELVTYVSSGTEVPVGPLPSAKAN